MAVAILSTFSTVEAEVVVEGRFLLSYLIRIIWNWPIYKLLGSSKRNSTSIGRYGPNFTGIIRILENWDMQEVFSKCVFEETSFNSDIKSPHPPEIRLIHVISQLIDVFV